MKRFHVHVAVPELSESIRFYSTLFGAEPTVRKDDYAKWVLDDPRVNFAISTRRASIISAPGRIAGGQRACMRRAPVFRCGASKQRGDWGPLAKKSEFSICSPNTLHPVQGACKPTFFFVLRLPREAESNLSLKCPQDIGKSFGLFVGQPLAVA